MANKGFNLNSIARRFLISTESVELMITSVDRLANKRKRYKLESKSRRYTLQILRAMELHPNSLKQEIKQLCYTAISWLYLHENEWLNTTLPVPTKPKRHIQPAS